MLQWFKSSLEIGPSSCDKTKAILSPIKHLNVLYFENLYLFSKIFLDQPKYGYLRILMNHSKEIEYYEYNNGDAIVSPQEIQLNPVMIFNDGAICNSNSNKIQTNFKFDSFHLCQK